MVDSETLKISIGAIIKDPEMLRLVSDHLKTKRKCKYAVKKLSFIIKYVSDRYIYNARSLGSVPDSYWFITQEMFDKAV